MEGCSQPAFYDPVLGYFDYCSPPCRDNHLLESNRKKLKEDIEQQKKEISGRAVSGSDTCKKVTLVRKGMDDLGLIVSKAKSKAGLLVTGIKVGSPAFSAFEEGKLKLLSDIYSINGQEAVSPDALKNATESDIELLVNTANSLALDHFHGEVDLQ